MDLYCRVRQSEGRIQPAECHSKGEAEFRIAIHPHLTGMGFGRQVAIATLKIGFLKLKMDRIHLIVRKNNYPA